jgi:20S proteasome alpha/beta subunit
MTIVAGFRYQNGVLLCSDTQQEGGALKIHGPKIGHFECIGGKVGFALAGNTAFATSAIQKCASRLKKIDASKAVTEIEKVLDREYRRVVLNHPDHQSNWNLAYWFLIALWEKNLNKVSLFATEETTVRSVLDYECLGIGRDLAHYLVRPSFKTSMSKQQASVLASYMLAIVKNNVPGCGGVSQLLAIGDDGFIEMLESTPINQMQESAEAYDLAVHKILFSLADESMSDSEFDFEIVAITRWLKVMRSVWRGDHLTRGDSLRALFDAEIRNARARQGQPNPQQTKDDSSHPQPSPESPGGSGES